MKLPEEVRRDFIRQWLAKAEEDFSLIEHLHTQGGSYLSAIGFHAQQAAEKFCKAFLVCHQVEFPKTHDLGELLELVATVDVALSNSLQGITELNSYSGRCAGGRRIGR